MIVEKVEKFLKEKGFAGEIMTAEESTATVDLAAAVLGVSPSRIAKTISFKLKDDTCVVIVSQGQGRIDNKKFKAVFNNKPKMLKQEEVLEFTGHPVGGVCPFAMKEGVKICLDVNLKEFATVFPAAGNAHSMIEVSPEELLRLTDGEWVDVCVE
jgi:Cys-tRNA(Pro) deacylase